MCQRAVLFAEAEFKSSSLLKSMCLSFLTSLLEGQCLNLRQVERIPSLICQCLNFRHSFYSMACCQSMLCWI